MQFALPPRRSPHLPVARSSRLPLYRRKQLKTVALFAFAVLSILYLLSHFYSSSTSLVAPAATTGVVIVTLLDHERFSESYLSKVIANREDYAKRHGKLIRSHLPAKYTKYNLTCARVYQLLRKRLRLRRSLRRLPQKLGYGPSRPPRHGPQPYLKILLPSEPSRPHHETNPVPQSTSPRSQPARVRHVEGCPHRAAR